MPRLKEVESALQQLDGFPEPKVLLEQYPTPAHIAAHMVFTMESSFADLAGKRVADLGCGCGMLTLGVAMFEPALVVGVEIDSDALETAAQNAKDLDLAVDLIHADIGPGCAMPLLPDSFDTVVMNPPFGTKKNAGIDVLFLQRAFALATGAVYSLHKTSTRQHILKKASEAGVTAEVIAELRYNLPATYKFHKKQSVDIEVDFLRFDCRAKSLQAAADPRT